MRPAKFSWPWRKIVYSNSGARSGLLRRYNLPDLREYKFPDFEYGSLIFDFIPDSSSLAQHIFESAEYRGHDADACLEAGKNGGYLLVDADLGFVLNNSVSFDIKKVNQINMDLAISLAQAVNGHGIYINAMSFAYIHNSADWREYEDDDGNVLMYSDLPSFNDSLPGSLSYCHQVNEDLRMLLNMDDFLLMGNVPSSVINPFPDDDLLCEVFIDDEINLNYQNDSYSPILIYPFATLEAANKAVRILDLMLEEARRYNDALSLLLDLQDES